MEYSQTDKIILIDDKVKLENKLLTSLWSNRSPEY